MSRPAGKNKRSHCRRCGVVMIRENLTTPLDLTVSQCDCAHVWTAGTEKPTNRGAEDIQRLRHKNRDEEEGQTKLNSGVRDLEKDVEYAGESSQGKGQEEER